MKAQKSTKRNISVFDKIKKSDKQGNEYWSARELGRLLGYTDFNLFLPVLDKARTACINAGQRQELHFKETLSQEDNKKEIQKNEDLHLSRYGCYLTIQNADPNLKAVAVGQAYMATQARYAELSLLQKNNNLKIVNQRRIFLRNQLAQRNVQLAGAARKAGIIKPADYALFQNHGYRGLYGGLDAKGIRTAKHLDEDQNILDHMDSTELAANLFRITQTTEKLTSDKVNNVVDANSIHFAVGLKLRKVMEDTGNILPENLPVMENIKLIEENEIPDLPKKKTKKNGTLNKK